MKLIVDARWSASSGIIVHIAVMHFETLAVTSQRWTFRCIVVVTTSLARAMSKDYGVFDRSITLESIDINL